jgi:hypothetical protein
LNPIDIDPSIEYYKAMTAKKQLVKSAHPCYYGRFKTGFWKQFMMKIMAGVMSFKKETDTKPTKYFRPGKCNE